MDKYIGRKIDGRYQVQELIGIGGMANVYKGYDPLENRVVAIKILREEYQDNEEFLRRFRNESKAIAVLSHPNIVRVYDVSLSDRMPSIVMEYIDGITLKEYIEQEGQVRWKEALHFTVQILRGLQHAHDNGVVHRDIKPQNLMLLRDGTIKITDFGIARFSRATSRTLTNHAIGSVHYISPEQARGDTADQKADLYSVGVMLFEMLTGKLPFDGENPVAVAVKQIESRPPRPRELDPDIPEGLEDITIRAMQKDPSRRYQSAAEMLRDIDLFRNDPSVSFEYKYMGEAVPSIRKKKKEEAGSKQKRKRRLPVIPVLTGITIAFVIATVAFVSLMLYLNDPFARAKDVDLPDLMGQDYETALRSEKYRQFDIQLESTEYNEQYENGKIFDQNPKPGKKVKEGTTILVKVSTGAQIIPMPGFAGQEVTLVVSRLRELGLTSSISEINSDTVQEGFVVRTDPDKGAQVPAGSKVTVYVSGGTGKERTKVPDVEGMNIDDARDLLLTDHGLKVNINYTESGESEGTILSQDPTAGSEVSKGSYVTLSVSMGDRKIKRVRVLVPLPESIKTQVTMKAVEDGVTVREDPITPSIDRVWRLSFSGEGSSQVKIFLNDKLYQEYEVDFQSETSSKVSDYSSSFVFEE